MWHNYEKIVINSYNYHNATTTDHILEDEGDVCVDLVLQDVFLALYRVPTEPPVLPFISVSPSRCSQAGDGILGPHGAGESLLSLVGLHLVPKLLLSFLVAELLVFLVVGVRTCIG